MIAAIIILSIQFIVLVACGIDFTFFSSSMSDEMYALLIGVALFSAFACVPAFIWNLMILKERGRTRDIVGLILSIVAFVLAVAFLIYGFVARIHGIGFTIF